MIDGNCLLWKCHSHRRLSISLPAFHKEQLKYLTWSIWGNGRHRMKCMTHSALCTKWLNYADDMLRFVGPFGRGGCGRAWPDLEGIKRLLCVWGWTVKIYKERHLKLKPDVCVSVFLCECANAVLVSCLPAMPLLSRRFFFKTLWFLKSYVCYN